MNTTDRIPNARKWTAEIVNKHLDAIEKEANEGFTPFLSSALRKQGLYKQVWSYWRRIFADDDDMIERMLVIDTMYESKLVTMALEGVISSSMAIRALKFSHKWGQEERQERKMRRDRSSYLSYV
jgi:hypothetical protein